MNEDEAFIRAIVDAPGDDTPRLVYADWLDDRADPRGPYLRAERKAAETGGATQVGELAAGLDPVWVARVSRPPVGVCVEQVDLTHKGPRIVVAEIAGIEHQYDLALPTGYRALLLNCNGAYALDKAADEEARTSIHNWRFYPLLIRNEGPSHRYYCESSIERELKRSREELASLPPHLQSWYSQFICIGHDPDYCRAVLLGVSGTVRDTIYLLDGSAVLEGWCELAIERRPYASSFTAFMASLPGWI